MKRNELRASLRVLGFPGEPERITAKLGLAPSMAWLAGESLGPNRQPRKTNGWEVEILGRDGEEPDAVIERLLEVVAGREAAVRELSAAATVELVVVVYAYEYMPGVSFSQAVVERLAQMGCAIDIDLYHFVEAESADT